MEQTWVAEVITFSCWEESDNVLLYVSLSVLGNVHPCQFLSRLLIDFIGATKQAIT